MVKRLAIVLACIIAAPAVAQDYLDEYDSYDTYSYVETETPQRDN